MVDILHRVGVKDPSPDKVYDALTTLEALAGWWTSDTSGGAGTSAESSNSASRPAAST